VAGVREGEGTKFIRHFSDLGRRRGVRVLKRQIRLTRRPSQHAGSGRFCFSRVAGRVWLSFDVRQTKHMDLDLTKFGFTMASVEGHEGWFKSQVLPQPHDDSPAVALQKLPQLSAFRVFEGSLDDEMPCIYVIPAIPLHELLRVFSVGAHGAMSYSYDQEEVISVVIERLMEVEKLVPLKVTYIDCAGFQAKFGAKVNQSLAMKIEGLFDVDAGMKEGLEGYICEWDGEGPIVWPHLVKEQAIRLWWD
jgi:hypothetical protein